MSPSTKTAAKEQPPRESMEQKAGKLCEKVVRYIEGRQGMWLRDSGQYYAVLDGGSILLDTEGRNDALDRLLIQAADHTTESPQARAAVRRLRSYAHYKAKDTRRVSFSFADESCCRIPILVSGRNKALKISAAGFEIQDNGNEGFWLEHPKGNPLPWDESPNPAEGLAKLDELLVKTATLPDCKSRLFTAGTAIFPFIRHRAPVRPILVPEGIHGAGKTTLSERPLRLFKLGKVDGDLSIAQCYRLGDRGLIVRDNVEQEDMGRRTTQLYFLQASTNGEWGRVGEESHDFPVVVATSIEGIDINGELGRRLIHFACQRDETMTWNEDALLADIGKNRALIFRGIAEIIRQFYTFDLPPLTAVPMTDFGNYCNVIHRILRAWDTLCGTSYAVAVMSAWASMVRDSKENVDSAGPLPRLLDKIYEQRTASNSTWTITASNYQFNGHCGDLLIASINTWLNVFKEVAQSERGLVLPNSSNGMLNRLRSLRPEHGWIVLTEEQTKPEGEQQPNPLARTNRGRSWGLLRIANGAPEPTRPPIIEIETVVERDNDGGI